jgi:hypothetical protein
VVDQGELEQRTDPGEVVEPRPGHLGAALDVDRTQQPAELDVVTGLEPLGREVARRAVLGEHHVVVFPADGRGVVNEVGQRTQQPVQFERGLGGRRLRALDLDRQVTGAGEQRLLLLALRPRDALAQRLLLSTQGFEGCDGSSPCVIGVQQPVDQGGVLAAGALRGTDAVGILSQDAQVDHASRLPSCGSTTPVPHPPLTPRAYAVDVSTAVGTPLSPHRPPPSPPPPPSLPRRVSARRRGEWVR